MEVQGKLKTNKNKTDNINSVFSLKQSTITSINSWSRKSFVRSYW